MPEHSRRLCRPSAREERNTFHQSDMWRTANLLLKRHGRDGAIIAAQRADECLAAGDLDGQALWRSIFKAVLELMRDKPRDGEAVY